METASLGFIGGGRVTRILLHAFQKRNAIFSKVIVSDSNQEVTKQLKAQFPEIQIDVTPVAAAQDIVFISLHPPVIMDTLELIKGSINSDSIVISLSPKITISKISSVLNRTENIVRLIPNATSYINEGYNPVCFSSGFPEDKKYQLLNLLKYLGNTFEVQESKLEAYAIMSAMLPTYFWFQWSELQSIGLQIGLTETECRESIQETLTGAVNLMYKSGLTSSEVIDLIPVKPIGDMETQITGIYRSKLPGLFEKIKP